LPIDVRQAAQDFQDGVQGKGQKWEREASNASREWEQNAKSDQAEQNYGQGVRNAVENRTRQRGLQGVSAGDFQGAVQGRGRAFEEGAAARAGKWGRKFSPYADVIERTKQQLPPKQPGQARQNTVNRAAPIAESLQNAKRQGVGGGSLTGRGGSPQGSPAEQQREQRVPAFE